MKRLILASILGPAFAIASWAQEKPPLLPPQIANPNAWDWNFGSAFERYRDSLQSRPKQETDKVLELKGVPPVPNGVCSVPLLEAHANSVDPGIAFTPSNTAVPIPQAKVPAPACNKK